MIDKYKAVWVSHSSIRDFLNCPRLYYLRNIHKDPLTGNKVTRMQPALALGQAVHEVIESLSTIPTEERLKESLITKLDIAWEKVAGERGGFKDSVSEEEYKERGRGMLQRVMNNPGPIAKKAIKIKADSNLPSYFISEEEGIILCGKIDWLTYDEETDTVHIIDFKTGRGEEDEDSLQLPIYLLLTTNCQSKTPSGASYWYLDRDDSPTVVTLPDPEDAKTRIMEVAKRIKLARQLTHFKCPEGDMGCKHCIPYEQIVKGKGKLVGKNDFRQDVYVI